MADYLYSKDHEWVLREGTRAKVGISEFAQSELGEIAFVELPEVGKRVSRGEAVCSIDSLKSTSEIYAPVSGTIVQVNETLADEKACSIINSDPLGREILRRTIRPIARAVASLESQLNIRNFYFVGGFALAMGQLFLNILRAQIHDMGGINGRSDEMVDGIGRLYPDEAQEVGEQSTYPRVSTLLMFWTSLVSRLISSPCVSWSKKRRDSVCSLAKRS